MFIEIVKLFEKTFIGDFSGVNTGLAFDLQIFLSKKEKDNLKLIYKIKTSNGNKNKRISTKILKMDENNHYGNTMTKPLPYGCIKKQKKIPSLRELNIILNNISHTDKIGHLFIVNIKFHFKTEKTLLFNELYTPIFEKSKLIKPYERSVLQLLSVLSRNEEKDIINIFKHNSKTHSTMKEKKIVILYAQHLHF